KNTDIRIILKNLDNIAPDLNRKLNDHAQKFGYLGYNTVGPVWGKEYFTDILRSLLSQNLNANKLLERIKKERSRIEKRQDEIVKKYKIDKKHRELFETARDMVFNKGARKDNMFRFYSVMEEFYKEFGRRYYLSVRQIRYLLPEEILEVLSGKREISPQSLNERYKFSIYLSENNKKDRFIIGDDARKYLENINLIQEDVENISLLQGDTASIGRIKGKVKIVNVTKDMEKMNKGDILVSIATTPDLVPAIKKASAIITDVGGITSHAAIVSREFNIPCVIGTRVATKVLKDNDLVDVDATHGKVKIIKRYKKK
ncbi:hypothetical protein K8R62_00335, partial [bacterium]|nr:hypothetical protein [bacterium]